MPPHLVVYARMFANEFAQKMLLSCSEYDLVIYIGYVHDELDIEQEMVSEYPANDVG